MAGRIYLCQELALGLVELGDDATHGIDEHAVSDPDARPLGLVDGGGAGALAPAVGALATRPNQTSRGYDRRRPVA